MILKIKTTGTRNWGQWVWLDKFDKVVDCGCHKIENDKIYHSYYDNPNQIFPSIAYIRPDKSDCRVVELIRINPSTGDELNWNIVAFHEAYLLNDEGKTIEKLSD